MRKDIIKVKTMNTTNILLKIWWVREILLSLQRRLLALRGKRAVLLYKKDVFERLSL